jgi:hypothetical protein
MKSGSICQERKEMNLVRPLRGSTIKTNTEHSTYYLDVYFDAELTSPLIMMGSMPRAHKRF